LWVFWGAQFIVYPQEYTATARLQTTDPALYQTVTKESHNFLGNYQAVDPEKVVPLDDSAAKATVKIAITSGLFSGLGKMALFPVFMLVCYLALITCFKTRGVYQPVQIPRDGSGALP
jgi:hypothetical protein